MFTIQASSRRSNHRSPRIEARWPGTGIGPLSDFLEVFFVLPKLGLSILR